MSTTGSRLRSDSSPSELELTATAEEWRRRLLLRHDGSGGWNAEVEDEGDVPGGPWDGSLPDLSEARDIDIENSPLTNTHADPAPRFPARRAPGTS